MPLSRPGIRWSTPRNPLRFAGGILSVVLLSGCPHPIGTPGSPGAPGISLPPPGALDRKTINELHVGRVLPERLVYRASTECINFFVTFEVEADFRRLGMAHEVIEALKSVCVNLETNPDERRARFDLEQDIGRVRAAEQYYAAARAYIIAQRFGAAEGEIWQAIRAAPTAPHTGVYYFVLGMAYYYQQKCDRAWPAFETAVQLDRSTGYLAYANAGLCFQVVNELDKARDAYERASGYSPSPEQQAYLDARFAELPRRAP